MKDKGSYRYFLIRTMGVFLATYVIIAVIYTCILAQYYSVQTEKTIDMFTNKIKNYIVDNGQIMSVDIGESSKQKLEMWQSGKLNQITALPWLFINPGKHPDNDAQLAVYNENSKKWIAKTGNCLIFKENNPLGVDQNALNESKGEDSEIYATLYIEHYLTKEQINSILEDENYGKGTFSVEGYYSEGEIIPQKLYQYELTYEQDNSNKLISKKLVNTYTFDQVIDTAKMIPFTGDSDHSFSRQSKISLYYDNYEGNWNWEEYNKALIPNMQDIVQGRAPRPDSKKSLFKVSQRQLEKVNVEGNTYWISRYNVCFPLYEIVTVSSEVYLFGIITAIILAGICSIVLWKRAIVYP